MSRRSDRPLVSVVIPAYNEGPLLADAIESALAQTYPHIEVVVVNDGSIDPRTRETAARFAGRILYIERENGGVAAARDTGLKASSGNLIALLDQDDRWLPHKVETQVRDLCNHPRAVLAHSSYYRINDEGERMGVSRLSEREWQPLPSLLIDVPIASGTALMRREAIERAGGFDPEIAGTDDWDLWLRMAARGGTFYCNAKPLAEYREHSANTSRNLDLMIRSTFLTLDKFYSMPDIPAVALPWRARAYAHRHTWAAINLYAAGSLSEARHHIVQAALLRPKSVTSLRFLRAITQTRVKHALDLVGRKLNRLQHHLREARAYYRASQPGGEVRTLRPPRTLKKETTLRAKSARTPWFYPADFPYGGQLSLATIDPTDAHGKMLGMIAPRSRVLETGCANGRFSAVLAEIGCQVVGVEIDPQAAQDARKFCERVIVGNLESATTLAQIPGGFDTIIFGDVLEHLVRPWQVLRALRDRLKPGGFIVVSIPNVAHWDARIGLLRGSFDYQQSGLLDATHLRFFTRRTAYELLRESGYRIVMEDDSLRLPMWVYSIRLVRRFAPKLLPLLSRIGPNLFTYQFVLKAVPAERSSGTKRGNPSTPDVQEARHT